MKKILTPKSLLLVAACTLGWSENPTKAAKFADILSSDNEKLSGQLFSPSISPSNIDHITFVRQEKDNRELWFYDVKSKALMQINPVASKEGIENWESGEDNSFFQSYTDQIDWCPVLHNGKQYITYVSAGKGNNMDIYIHEISSKVHTRLTYHTEVDQSPRWSPDGKSILFVSARSGNGDLYLIKDITKFLGKENPKIDEKSFAQITSNPDEDMLPAFSPDGQYIAFTARTPSKLNRGPFTIALVDLKDKMKVKVFNNRITNSKSHPSWSFDGHFVAYQISNDLKDQNVDIGVLQLKKDPMGRLIELTDLIGNTPKIAENVYPNTYKGPAWLPGSRALIYAKRESQRLNPLEIVNLEQWLYNQDYKRTTIETESNIHRDVYCVSSHPVIVFAGQKGLTYQIFGAYMEGDDIKHKGKNFKLSDYVLFK